MPRRPVIAPHSSFSLICPNAKCQAQNFFAFDGIHIHNNLICLKCSLPFVTRIAKVRTARSSHGVVRLGNGLLSPAAHARNFSVRIINFDGNEDLIEFVNYSDDTFEFKSSDIVCFTYAQNKLKVVQNFTVNRWMSIITKREVKGCCGPTVATSVLILSYLLWLLV